MNNIYTISNEKFKSMYFSINFTIEGDKKKISQSSVLASVLGKSCEKYKTEKQIQEYLFSLYGANFDVGVEKIGDLYNIEFSDIKEGNFDILDRNFVNKVEICLDFVLSIPNISGKLSMWRHRNDL